MTSTIDRIEPLAPAPSDDAAAGTTATEPPKTKRPGLGIPFWLAIGWLSIVVFCALFGGLLPLRALDDPDFIAASEGRFGFTGAHPLGLDENGNDMLAMVVHGARTSVIIALGTIFFGFIVGGGLGMLAGFLRGWVDTAATFFTTCLLSIPSLLLLLLFANTLRERGWWNMWTVTLTIGFLAIPTLYRVVRASTLAFAQREFVLAARATGAKKARILRKEIFPNVIKPLLAFGLVGVGTIMVVEGTLSYLGLGVDDRPAWGKIIQSGAQISPLKRYPHIVFVPAIVLFLTVLSLNFAGDKLRERFDVKQGAI